MKVTKENKLIYNYQTYFIVIKYDKESDGLSTVK